VERLGEDKAEIVTAANEQAGRYRQKRNQERNKRQRLEEQLEQERKMFRERLIGDHVTAQLRTAGITPDSVGGDDIYKSLVGVALQRSGLAVGEDYALSSDRPMGEVASELAGRFVVAKDEPKEPEPSPVTVIASHAGKVDAQRPDASQWRTMGSDDFRKAWMSRGD
jgi:hypothetical protein